MLFRSNQFNPYYNIVNFYGGVISEITGTKNSPYIAYKILKLYFNSNLYIKIDLFLTEPLISNNSTIILKNITIFNFKASLLPCEIDVNEYVVNGIVTIVRGKITNGSDGKYNVEMDSISGDTYKKITIEPLIVWWT